MQSNLPNGEVSKGSHAAPVPTRGALETPGIADTLRQLRSQTPSESLGLASQSGLFKASIQAGVVIGVLFALLTVGPYLYEKSKGGAKKEEPAPAEKADGDKAAPQPAAQPTNPTSPDTGGKQATVPSPVGKNNGKDDILNKLGESGTKTGNPKLKDPFKAGGGDDDLLKDIK